MGIQASVNRPANAAAFAAAFSHLPADVGFQAGHLGLLNLAGVCVYNYIYLTLSYIGYDQKT